MQRTTKTLSIDSARRLASELWTNHRHGRGASPAVDRDFSRQAEELYYLTQAGRAF